MPSRLGQGHPIFIPRGVHGHVENLQCCGAMIGALRDMFGGSGRLVHSLQRRKNPVILRWDTLLGLLKYAGGAISELLSGTLQFRCCRTPFAKQLLLWALSEGAGDYDGVVALVGANHSGVPAVGASADVAGIQSGVAAGGVPAVVVSADSDAACVGLFADLRRARCARKNLECSCW